MRGGIYDRIQVRQDLDTFTFRDLDYLTLYGIEAAGAPRLSRIGHLHHSQSELQCRLPVAAWCSSATRSTGRPAQRRFARFEREYWLPARYLAEGAVLR